MISPILGDSAQIDLNDVDIASGSTEFYTPRSNQMVCELLLFVDKFSQPGSNNPQLMDFIQSRWALRILAVALIAACMSGCVRRRMTVRSNPPGAMLYIDDQQIGQTPVATDFIYYGTRKIKLVKDGFETMTTYQTISPPWYQIPPLDFVSENLVGREIRDERIIDFNLKPQRVVPTQELLGRASGLRQANAQEFFVPAPGSGIRPGSATPAYQGPNGIQVPQPGQQPVVDPFLGL